MRRRCGLLSNYFDHLFRSSCSSVFLLSFFSLLYWLRYHPVDEVGHRSVFNVVKHRCRILFSRFSWLSCGTMMEDVGLNSSIQYRCRTAGYVVYWSPVHVLSVSRFPCASGRLSPHLYVSPSRAATNQYGRYQYWRRRGWDVARASGNSARFN